MISYRRRACLRVDRVAELLLELRERRLRVGVRALLLLDKLRARRAPPQRSRSRSRSRARPTARTNDRVRPRPLRWGRAWSVHTHTHAGGQAGTRTHADK